MNSSYVTFLHAYYVQLIELWLNVMFHWKDLKVYLYNYTDCTNDYVINIIIGNVKVDKSSKGVIYADFKISKNGSYQVHLDKGTTLYVTVDINPCRKCQHKTSLRQLDLTNQIASPVEGGTSQFTGFPRPSYDMESPSSGPHIQTVRTELIN